MIHLEKIACNLYLGNLESAFDQDLLAKTQIKVVINLSDSGFVIKRLMFLIFVIKIQEILVTMNFYIF